MWCWVSVSICGFGRTIDKKMAELQLVMLYEPVQCIGFRLFQFLQGVEVPEKYSPSESMTPSMSIQVQNLQHSIRDA